MARRHSLQSPPDPPGPPSPGGAVIEPKDETSQGASNTTGRKRSSSVTGFLAKFLPSHRPERSGTLRDQGFWEQRQSDQPVREQRPGLGHKHGSDSIVSSGWNPAVELPRRAQTARDRRPERQTPLRERSQPIGNRPKSATLLRRQFGERGRQQDRPPLDITNDTRTQAEVFASTISRQPLGAGLPPEDTSQTLVTTFDAKREARRLRRSLKESRDFLGVQGVNPHTGVMDVLTPTSSSPTDRAMMSAPEAEGYSESLSGFRAAYRRESRTRDAEEASLERLRKEQERLDKTHRKKDSIRNFQQRVRWRKDTNQWSSVAEPDLSPIADASTRSRTPRSTSDGAIECPPAGQEVLPREERRSVSTPALPQTIASAPGPRPGITTQESSDTVIHTLHPEGRRRHSLAAHIFGKRPESSSPEDTRRASEPAPSAVLGSSGSSTGDRSISRKPVPPPKDKHRPPPLRLTIPGAVEQHPALRSSNHQDSFLGTRTDLDGARYRHIPDHGIVSPSIMKIENEKRSFGTPPNMGRSPITSPPDVAVRDFARDRSRELWFASHPSSLDYPPKASSSSDQSRDTNEATAISSRPQQRTLHLYRTPLIPLRMNPSKNHTSVLPESQVNEQSVNLVDVGIPPETADAPSEGWAKQLMDDIASFGHDTGNHPSIIGDRRESSPRTELVATSPEPAPPKAPPISASIPITTITGYDPRLLVHTRGLYRRPRSGGPPAGIALKDDRVIRISATEAATKLQIERRRTRGENDTQQRDDRATRVSTTELVSDDSEVKAEVRGETGRPAQKATPTSVQQQTQPTFDLQASPPQLPQSVWPSPDIHAPQWRQQQQQHRMPQRRERRSSAGPVTEIVPYETGPGPASGITSSPLRPQSHTGVGLSVPEKTALIYAAAQESPAPILPPTSAPQLAATRERCERLYRRVSRLHPAQGPDSEATMTPAIGPCINGTSSAMATARNTNISPYRRPATTVASLTCTSTYHASLPKYRDMPRLSPSSSSNLSPSHSPNSRSGHSSPRKLEPAPVNGQALTPREPATEAARAALMGMQCDAAVARTVPGPSRKRDKNDKMPTSSAPSDPDSRVPAHIAGGSADTDGRSREEVVLDKHGVPRVAVHDASHASPRLAHRATQKRKDKQAAAAGIPDLLLTALAAYWSLVAPVFDAGSPVSKRFSAGTSTWHDCVVYLLALAFVLAGFLAAVWAVKAVLLIAGLARAVGRFGLVLVGFRE